MTIRCRRRSRQPDSGQMPPCRVEGLQRRLAAARARIGDGASIGDDPASAQLADAAARLLAQPDVPTAVRLEAATAIVERLADMAAQATS